MTSDVVLQPISEAALVNPPLTREVNPDDKVSFIPMVDVSDSGQWVGKQTRRQRDVSVGYTSFEEGDILFAKITPCMENGKGCHAIGLMNGIGYGSTEFHVLRAKPGTDSRFLYHWTMTEAVRKKAEAFMIGSAGQQRVQASFFDFFRIPKLNEGEQQFASRILDAADEAIAKTEALIAKLKAIKQGLLHDLLTRGLDENGELRDPERQPEKFITRGRRTIPAVWRTTTLGEITRIRRGASPRPIDDPKWFAYEGPGWVRISDVTKATNRLRVTEQRLSPAGVAKSVPVHVGDVIMSICATIGEPIIVDMEACIHDGFVVFDQYDQVMLPEFLVFYLRWMQDYFRGQGQTGTQANLNSSIVRDARIDLPPIDEQQLVVDALIRFDSRIESEEAYLSKLKAIKKGLMQDLLTGRVRVTALQKGGKKG